MISIPLDRTFTNFRNVMAREQIWADAEPGMLVIFRTQHERSIKRARLIHVTHRDQHFSFSAPSDLGHLLRTEGRKPSARSHITLALCFERAFLADGAHIESGYPTAHGAVSADQARNDEAFELAQKLKQGFGDEVFASLLAAIGSDLAASGKLRTRHSICPTSELVNQVQAVGESVLVSAS